MKTIALINGPYDGREIEDSGAVRIRMGVSTDGDNIGAAIGEAVYEPNPERTLAFWSNNLWKGTLEEVIPG